MLLLGDVEASIPLAQELEQCGKVLSTKIGPLSVLVSELSVAVSSCGAMMADDDGYKSRLTEIVGLIHETSASTSRIGDNGAALMDCSKHDIKTEDFAALITTGVMATMAKAKGVAIPLIGRLENAVTEKMISYEDRCMSNIVIEQAGLDSILDCDEVFEYFSEYKDRRRVAINNVNCFPPLTTVQLAALVETGSPEINEYLTNCMTTTVATGELGAFIYRYLFEGDGRSRLPVEIFELRNLLRDIYGDYAVLEGLMLAYYMGKGLVANIPEGTNAAINELERRMGLVTSLIGLMIYGILDKHRESITAKVLLPVSYPHVDRDTGRVNATSKIIVNKEVYASFLADGGCPEILFGAMVSDRETDMASLLAGNERYCKEYEKFVALNRSYTTSSKLSIHTTAIRDEFYKAVSDTEELKGIDKAGGIFLRLDDKLKRMGANDISTPECLYAYIKSLVCSCVFPTNPDVEKVISDIDNFVCAEGEELTVSEIATFVLIDLIVDWLTDQIEVRAV